MFPLTVVFLFLVSSSNGLQEGESCMSEVMSKFGIQGMCKKECPYILSHALKLMGEKELMECGSQDGVKSLCCPTGVVVTSTEAPVTSTEAPVTSTEARVTSTLAPGEPCMSEVMSKFGIQGMCKKECPFILSHALKLMGEKELMECGSQDGVKSVCCPTGVVVTSTEAPVTSTEARVTSTLAPGEPCMSEMMKKVGIQGMCRKECPYILSVSLRYLGEKELMECDSQDGVKTVCCPTGVIVTSTEASVTSTEARVTSTVAPGEPCMSEMMKKVGIQGICRKQCTFISSLVLRYLGEEELMECSSKDGVKTVCCPNDVVDTSAVPVNSSVAPVTSSEDRVTSTEAPITSTVPVNSTKASGHIP